MMPILEKYKEQIIKYNLYDGYPPYLDELTTQELDEMEQAIMNGEYAKLFEETTAV